MATQEGCLLSSGWIYCISNTSTCGYLGKEVFDLSVPSLGSTHIFMASLHHRTGGVAPTRSRSACRKR